MIRKLSEAENDRNKIILEFVQSSDFADVVYTALSEVIKTVSDSRNIAEALEDLAGTCEPTFDGAIENIIDGMIIEFDELYGYDE